MPDDPTYNPVTDWKPIPMPGDDTPTPDDTAALIAEAKRLLDEVPNNSVMSFATASADIIPSLVAALERERLNKEFWYDKNTATGNELYEMRQRAEAAERETRDLREEVQVLGIMQDDLRAEVARLKSKGE